MDLLIAGIVLLLLFVATYSQRRTWVTLGSTALTIVLIGGAVFFSTAQGPSQIHKGLSQLAKALPTGWDQPALKLTAAMEQASTSLARARQEAARESPPVLTASLTNWFSWGSWFKAEPEAERTVGPKPGATQISPVSPAEVSPAEVSPAEVSPADVSPAAASDSSNAPIKWFLDAPQDDASEAFAVRGANLSDQPLKLVRAVLKPDTGAGKLKLTLAVDGQDGAGTVVPPGARFHLKAEGLTASEAEKLGGAILSVAYEQAGRRKTSIMYLTPATLTASD